MYNLAFLSRLVALLNLFCQKIIVLRGEHRVLFRCLYNFSSQQKCKQDTNAWALEKWDAVEGMSACITGFGVHSVTI